MRSTQSRTFFAAASVLLIALLILGIALRTMVADYLSDAAYEALDNDCQVLSQLTTAYGTDGSVSNMQFIIHLDVAARVSGTDALICGPTGRILICSDSPNGCAHQALTFSQDFVDRVVREGGTHEVGVLRELYSESRYIAASPIWDENGEFWGIVVVSTPNSGTTEIVEKFSHIFIIGSLLVLLLGTAIMAYITRRNNRPLRDMARAAHAFGHGNLEARVPLPEKCPEEVENLALAFNNMASSLQKSEYQRQEFVANVSHELKTPMTTISGYVDGILDGTIPPERARHYMQIVSDETKRLSRLVRSMLDISMLQSEGKIPEEKMTRFDIEECAGEMLITFEQKILAKNLDVRVQMPDHPIHTMANRDYISQVIYNLLDNAVKFCPEGGVLELTIRPSDEKVSISVANQGNSIPPEELPLVFDRFHKIDKSRSQNREGWGLGLYIVKTIVDYHGENISVTSLDGRTEFTFTLPLEN